MKKRIILGAFIIFALSLMVGLTYFVLTLKPTPQAARYQVVWEDIENDPTIIKNGEFQYQVRCSECHGVDATGLGQYPNLIDDFYMRYNGSNDDALNIVNNGIPGTEMKGWSGKLKSEDIQAIVVFLSFMKKKPAKPAQPPSAPFNP